jgi:hypothetical protein
VHEGKLEYEELLRNNQTLANALAPFFCNTENTSSAKADKPNDKIKHPDSRNQKIGSRGLRSQKSS